MMVVERGSSTGREASPNHPPTPPDAPASSLWNRSEERLGCRLPIVVTAALSAVVRDAFAALFTILCQPLGSSLNPRSMGLPNLPARRAVKPGFSINVFARARSPSSGGVRFGNIGGNSMRVVAV